MNNVLDLIDQAAFLAERATRSTNVLQCCWLYREGVDLDGLRRFHHHLQRGRLARRIERSPLPFGRHRWVSAPASTQLEIVESRYSRSQFDAWLDEQADLPLDVERGPGWHLAVLPFTDGGAGVSFVTTHCLTDGVGFCAALADAADGRDDPINWPAARSRRRWRALGRDTRQTARDLPEVGRALRAAARLARDTRGTGRTAAPAPARFARPDGRVALATATLFVDGAWWDARARALGGTSNALLAAVTARLARQTGRVTTEGVATVAIPVNERVVGDTRANAITAVDIEVDSTAVTTDLTAVRAAVKNALIHRGSAPDERSGLLPLTPWLPRWAVRRMVGVALGGATTSGSSNLGPIDPAVNRPDGNDADCMAMRSLYPRATRATMRPTGGLLGVVSGRVDNRIFLSALSHRPAGRNSNPQLQKDFSEVLREFGILATAGWPTAEHNAHNRAECG
ncbi:hypothetical protein [Mycobacterium camsae]|uniref:hypothetical protein n=1 Tax=Mycobacterium gordonae TaxID=1778 RepID=UPI001980EE8F|nr:hypothetical protein [Mycobacterium gordonae]